MDSWKTKQPRVLACIPIYAGLAPHPFFSFMQMQRDWMIGEFSKLYTVRLVVPGPKMKIQYARNIAVNQAINSGATHVFFVDDDFICPEDTLFRLLTHDVDIVGPLFFRGGGDFAPLVFEWTPDHRDLQPVKMWKEDTLMECDGIGTGCVLIKTEVFQKVGPPYFYYPEALLDRTMDLQFCIRAKQRGCKIYCDTTFDCQQMGLPTATGKRDYLLSQEFMKGEADEKEQEPGPDLSEVQPGGSAPVERDPVTHYA